MRGVGSWRQTSTRRPGPMTWRPSLKPVASLVSPPPDDVTTALAEGRSPIRLTERKAHLEFLAASLRGVARHLVVLRGGMTPTERRAAAATLAAITDAEYVDRSVPLLARMFEKRLRGYRAIGYARGSASLIREKEDDEALESFDTPAAAE